MRIIAFIIFTYQRLLSRELYGKQKDQLHNSRLKTFY